MKNLALRTTLMAAPLALGACVAAPYQGGLLYSGYSAPAAVTSNPGCAKKGSADMMNVLGLVGVGDASIEAAKAAGGITTVSSVDYKQTSFLGVFGRTETIVCGS